MIDERGIFRTTVEFSPRHDHTRRREVRDVMVDTGSEYTWLPRTGTEIAGAWTIPEARRQGAQLALLHARLTFAANLGVDLAMVVTQPGSASHRYAERQGFRPVYTRAKWQRAGDAFVR